MLAKCLFVLALLIVAAHSDYNVMSTCGSFYLCPYNCRQCQSVNGGPFNNLVTCVDNMGGCTANAVFNISISCGGCPNGFCSYAAIQSGSYPYYGCIAVDDPSWYSNYKRRLDQLYYIATNSLIPYDWCGNTCSGGIPAAGVVFIVLGVLILVGVIGFFVYKYLKKRSSTPLLTAEKNTQDDLYASIKNSQ